MREGRTFSSRAIVECDRNFFRVANTFTLQNLVTVASDEGVSDKFCDFPARWNYYM